MRAMIGMIGVFWLLAGGIGLAERKGVEGVAIPLVLDDGRKLLVSIVGIEGEDVAAVDAKGKTIRVPLIELSRDSAAEVLGLRRKGLLLIAGMPPEWSLRQPAEVRRKAGGGEDVEAVVLKALDFLRSEQKRDGSWGVQNPSAMTGLALLCFLGHAETPLSVEYGETVLRGMAYLINLGTLNNGKLIAMGREKENHWPYEHAIATWALAEGTVFCRQVGVRIPDLPEVTRKAGQYIIDNQHKSGGWDYKYNEDSGRGGDLSITAWHMQALRACDRSQMHFRGMSECRMRGMEYVAGRQHSSGGFGYVTEKPCGKLDYHTLTGAGLFAFQVWGQGDEARAEMGVRYLEERSKFDYDSEFCDLYGHFFESHALRNAGGNTWQAYRKRMVRELKAHQQEEGNWELPGGGNKPRAVACTAWASGSEQAAVMRACLCTLILESGYRCVMGGGSGN